MEAGTSNVSLPGRPSLVGRLHPITQTLRDILAVLTQMGFQVTEGPEVEREHYNFEALRREDHPARDMHDTFWLDNKQGREALHASAYPDLANADPFHGNAPAADPAQPDGARLPLRGHGRHARQGGCSTR